jgi:hypothetical protein
VKYEDLVDHPERELRRLCGFLGEDYDPAMLRYARREDAGYLEVEESWKGLTRQELTRARVGRYRGRLTPRQVWTVERLESVLGSATSRPPRGRSTGTAVLGSGSIERRCAPSARGAGCSTSRPSVATQRATRRERRHS